MILHWNGTIELLAPLSHNSDESGGTETKLRRIKWQGHDGVHLIPVYSGNAFRGLLRRRAALDFLERIGITQQGEEKISDRLYYMLFCGGSLAKGSTAGGKLNVGLKREIRDNIPFLSLFGTAVQNQMLQGKMTVGIAVPRCTEVNPDADRSAWDLVDQIFYTRRDDLEDKERSEKEQAQQMKYTIECLSTGTVLTHEFSLRHPTDLEISCFGAIMRSFDENGTLGGKGGAGHGKVKLEYEPEWPDPVVYHDYVESKRSAIHEYIRSLESSL